ncbi:MAG TPA: hypothetical protein VL485_08510 [Ktedonobacteraceae bacterium]|jgi:hypothetical protein|nr:hypothetical protein [Ktedonobacteraceae bacterium]
MNQGQDQSGSLLADGAMQPRNGFLLRHPLLTPLLFLSGAALFGIASGFTDTLFPVLAFFGVPALPFCISLASVLGLSGILICIIHMVEYFDRYCFKIALYPKSKEHSYVSN